MSEGRWTWFLLWCRDCQMPERAPMVFDSAAERGAWCAAHTKGTGHDRWRVKDEPAGPPPGVYTCGGCWSVFPERQLDNTGVHQCEGCGLQTTLVTRIEMTVDLADGTTCHVTASPRVDMWSKAGGPPPWSTLGRALHQMAAADLPSVPADVPEHGGSHAVR